MPLRRRSGPENPAVMLRACLIEIGDALQAVSMDSLHERGGWDHTLFEDVLGYVEQGTPDFQAALIAFLALPERRDPALLRALLAVDRLSAAYTYWTRLFPPRQSDESMFVLSLLHDLSEKVEHAIALLDEAGE